MSQDAVYAISLGRQKTAKHVLISHGIKTLTGNVELIQMMNRLDHDISYHQLEENGTSICLEKLAGALNDRVVLTKYVQPYVFTNLSWDTIDRLEATLTGAGTSHRVNGIAVQTKVYGPHLPKDAVPAIGKTKKRTVPIETQERKERATTPSGFFIRTVSA